MRLIWLAIVFSAFLLPLDAAPGNADVRQTPDRLNAVLATVNGEPVSLGDVLPLTQVREYQAAAAYSGDKLAEEVYKLRLEAVDELIDNKLILADYATKPFEIPERDIEAAMDEASSRMGVRSRQDLSRKLRERGDSVAEFRRKVREQLIIHVMLYREYNASNFITPEDLRRYYAEHEKDFSKPDRLELAMLQLQAERNDVAKVSEDIAAALAADPEAFADLVRLHSSGPGRSDGGRLGGIERRRLRREFAEAIGDSPVAGRIYGPLKTDDGIFWLRVLEYHPAEKVSFESAAPDIRRRMETELRRECRERYCARLRKAAIVRYFIPNAPVGAGSDKAVKP